jgi:hypothetical protein
MCECGATIVLQRAKHRVGISLIAGAIQIAVTVVTADVIAERVNSAEVADDAMAAGANVEDSISHIQGSGAIITKLHSVIAHSAIRDARSV